MEKRKMNSKNLKVIQTVCKIARVLSMICFISCIVGASLLVTGEILYLISIKSPFLIDGLSITDLITKYAELSESEIIAGMETGLIKCLSAVAVSAVALVYFKKELAAGTPFTTEGAKWMLILDIVMLVAPSTMALTVKSIMSIMLLGTGLYKNIEIEGFGEMTSGLIVIFMSFIIRYGTELISSSTPGNDTATSDK